MSQTQEITPSTLGEASVPKTRSLPSRALRQLRGSVSGKIGLALVLLVIIMALFAPIIAPHSPYTIRNEHRLLGPSSYYPLGTDEFGRDILSRIIYGARTSILIGFGVVALSTVIATVLGTASGYFEG